MIDRLWIQLQAFLDKHFSRSGSIEVTLEDEDTYRGSLNENGLKHAYDELITSLEAQREEIYRDVQQHKEWVVSMPDRRHLRHLNEELDSIDRDIYSVKMSQQATWKDKSDPEQS